MSRDSFVIMFMSLHFEHIIRSPTHHQVLVGGLEHFFIFHNIWDIILPIDFHIFQHG